MREKREIEFSLHWMKHCHVSALLGRPVLEYPDPNPNTYPLKPRIFGSEPNPKSTISKYPRVPIWWRWPNRNESDEASTVATSKFGQNRSWDDIEVGANTRKSDEASTVAKSILLWWWWAESRRGGDNLADSPGTRRRASPEVVKSPP